MAKPKLILCWSSGKDSAWALHRLRQQDDFDIIGLLTTINEAASRVAMHAVRESLLDRQAAAAGLPLLKVHIPHPCPNETYEQRMAEAVAEVRKIGVGAFAFGDLFLEDVRQYREKNLAGTGIEPVFPLWGLDTGELAREMVASGLAARITCIDPKQLDPAFAGRAFDAAFLDNLPDTVDPCGENGEFHSFAHRGPMFVRPIPITPGEIVERDGFVFADLLPG
ncbi:MAG: adenine nucleotide alpha hydrolase [Alphaproteobacteria bacterium]|nr:adenine nucleotide alpha hydrolase [Alphaproteobacteria bacterium]